MLAKKQLGARGARAACGVASSAERWRGPRARRSSRSTVQAGGRGRDQQARPMPDETSERRGLHGAGAGAGAPGRGGGRGAGRRRGGARTARSSARGRNAPVGSSDPTAHAEIVALRAAAQAAGQLPAGRLRTVRDAGALRDVQRRHAARAAGAGRLRRCRSEDRRRRLGGRYVREPRLNHRTQVQGGVMAADCAALLTEFFKARTAAMRASAASPCARMPCARQTSASPDLPGYPWRRAISAICHRWTACACTTSTKARATRR